MVIIKDFPMPKNCFECLLYEEDLKFCIVGSQGCVNRYGYDPNEKPLWCPLAEVLDINGENTQDRVSNSTKTTGDDISRQMTIDAIVNTPTDIYSHDRIVSALDGAAFRQNEIIDIINALPSIGQEQKKGKWIFDGDYFICSECKSVFNWWAHSQCSNYCPNCGAEMKGEEE